MEAVLVEPVLVETVSVGVGMVEPVLVEPVFVGVVVVLGHLLVVTGCYLK